MSQLCLTPTGKRFHFRHCRTLHRSRALRALSPESPAEVLRLARTRTKCKVCRPPAGGALRVVGETILDHALMVHGRFPRPVILERKVAPVAEGRGWRATDYGTRKELADLAKERFAEGFIYTVAPGTDGEKLDAHLAHFELTLAKAALEAKPVTKRGFRVVKPQDPFKGFAPA